MNPSTALAALVVDALAGAGVRQVLLCPGSRSAPLAYELARRQLPGLHVRHDERVAGFTALGVSKGGPGLGAVVTTSGTAVANLFPAVLEGHHANVPLVVVTADRPARLRGTWANQTSELQAGLFGDAVRASLDLADDEAAADPVAARTALDRVLGAALGRAGRRPGPVHLNLGFDEPLTPPDEGPLPEPTVSRRPYPAPPEPAVVPPLPAGPRTVVLAGDGASVEAAWLAETAGWPLLAEPSSGARVGPNAIGPYRLLLELPELGGRVERVVAFGRPTLSRPVTRLLGRDDVEVLLVSRYPDWPEPGRPVVRLSAVPWPTGSDPLAGDPPPTPAEPDEWLSGWLRAGAAASAALDAVLDREPAITGPLVAREVAAGRRCDVLLAGASNPIRDLDLAAAIRTRTSSLRAGDLPVRANRGLSGIDGTISTAIGLALGGERVRVLVGDVTFLHDAAALLLGPHERRPDLQVIVLNDNGGGIFSLLEHGERALHGEAQRRTFERVFGTPHTADLAALCRGYGVGHRRVGDLADLRRAVADLPTGISVVEVVADRAGLRDLHGRIRAAVHAAARDALGPG